MLRLDGTRGASHERGLGQIRREQIEAQWVHEQSFRERQRVMLEWAKQRLGWTNDLVEKEGASDELT